MHDMFEILKTLTELPGMTGCEERVNRWLAKEWSRHARSVQFDRVGNLIAHIGGEGPSLLIEAHADEIGFVVKSIDNQGYVWLAPGVVPNAKHPSLTVFLVGHPALIASRHADVMGVFAAISGHNANLVHPGDNPLGWNDVFVDIGARNQAEALDAGIRVGDSVIWNPSTRRMGEYIVGKAMDDRAGLAIITKLLQQVDPTNLHYDLTVASTVQEEMTSMIGAAALARSSLYDFAISLEISMAGDTPGMSLREMPTRLGGGPVIIRHDRAVRYNEQLSNGLFDCAKQHNISVQSCVLQRAATNGREFLRAGIPTALVGFTTRYTHSPFETIAEQDLLETVALLQSFLESDPLELTYEERFDA